MFDSLKYKTYRTWKGKSYKFVDAYSSKKQARKKGKSKKRSAWSSVSRYRVIKRDGDYLLYVH